MSDRNSTETPKDKVGLDDIVEDAFGLNVRGLQTLWAMIVRPAKVFEAARSPDWSARSYTPSIRLVFSLLAVLTAIRFLWASDGSMFYETTVLAIEQAGSSAFGTDIDAATEALMDIYVVIFPLAMIGLHIGGSSFTFVWGKGTKFPARLRLYFLAIVPSTIYTVFLTVGMSFASLDFYTALMALTILGTWVLDFATSLRGGVQAKSKVMRALKAAIFAMVSFTIGMAANFGAFIGAQFWFIYAPW